MIPNELIKEYKREIIMGVVVAFFLVLSQFLTVVIKIALSQTKAESDGLSAFVLLINVGVLALLVWLIDRA